MLLLPIATFLPTVFAIALPQEKRQAGPTWSLANFNSLITFGDSYTDENRLTYLIEHNTTQIPNGTYFPEGLNTASGGRTWPRFVVRDTYTTSANGSSMPGLTLYDYAVSGAVCSNQITPRYLSAISGDFPDVLNDEITSFTADQFTDRNGTSLAYFTPPRTSSADVYSLWIGTNDLGVNAFLTDSQVRGKTLTDYTDCIYAVFDKLYTLGARYFVLFNNAPLNLAPLYANESIGGVLANQYWPNPPPGFNKTQVAETMHEYTTTTNTIFRYQTPYDLLIAGRYPGANIALFDVWQLMSDIYDNPASYLNGTQPANVTGYEHHCSTSGGNCTLEYGGASSDSFMWYDELHPSEQTDRVIAAEFVRVINGSSSYAMYY